ncbi:hypothetical protein ACFPM3_00090 [Streptomyces coeruleoprunus]|uniref:Integral membrane protein n=1 Tax=Streptomyces coeruleoprunus TaxID=285563 RepID=A0ABV9X4V6_9ACTN
MPGPRLPYGPGPGWGRPSLWQRFRDDEWPTLREVLSYLRAGKGCVLLAFLCCVWPTLFVVIGYPLARWARILARRVFPVHSRSITDPDVIRTQKVRAWVAAVASFLILAAYGTAEDWEQAQEQFFMRLTLTPWLLLLTTPLVVLVLFLLAPASARPGMRRGIWPAGRSALCYFGAFTATPLLFLGGMYVAELMEQNLLGLAVRIAVLLPPLWTLLFVGFASGRAVRTAFNTTEVHPTLPALLTGVLVWELAAVNLLFGGPPPGPPAVQILALLCGPASVTAVAWWEVHRLRTRYGVSLRR